MEGLARGGQRVEERPVGQHCELGLGVGGAEARQRRRHPPCHPLPVERAEEHPQRAGARREGLQLEGAIGEQSDLGIVRAVGAAERQRRGLHRVGSRHDEPILPRWIPIIDSGEQRGMVSARVTTRSGRESSASAGRRARTSRKRGAKAATWTRSMGGGGPAEILRASTRYHSAFDRPTKASRS